jgi:hypothetical protein
MNSENSNEAQPRLIIEMMGREELLFIFYY